MAIELRDDQGNVIEYVTAEEGAERLGPDIKPSTIWKWHSDHDVNGYRIGRSVWFRLSDLEDVEAVKFRTPQGRPRGST